MYRSPNNCLQKCTSCIFHFDLLFQLNFLKWSVCALSSQVIWGYDFILLSEMIKIQRFTYLKYGPCRPETRSAVGVKIQTENATHWVSQAESAAWIVQQPQSENFPQTSSKSVCVLIEKQLKRRTRCVFHTPIQRTGQTMRLSTLSSPKVGVEESGASAAAPHSWASVAVAD